MFYVPLQNVATSNIGVIQVLFNSLLKKFFKDKAEKEITKMQTNDCFLFIEACKEIGILR